MTSLQRVMIVLNRWSSNALPRQVLEVWGGGGAWAVRTGRQWVR